MKRVVQHGLAGLALISGGLAFTAACQHNDSSLFVQNVLYPTPVASGQSCIYTNNPDQSVLSSGALDVTLTQEYVAEFLVGNQLVAQENSQNLMTETSTINIEGAIVTVTDAAGNQLDFFKSLTSGTVYPSTGSTPGYAALSATIISQKATNLVAGTGNGNLPSGSTITVVSYVKFYGHTLGGTYIESNNFEFPVDLCAGCLINYSGSSLSECNGIALKQPNCLGSSSTSTSLPVPCAIGQDFSIPCSACSGSAVCRGEYPDGLPQACLSLDGGTD
jgi:hypothetical protein